MDDSLIFLTSGPRRGSTPTSARASRVHGWRSLLVAGLALSVAACASPSVPTPEPEAQPPAAEPAPPQESYETLTAPLEQFAEPLAQVPPPPVKVGLLLPLSGPRAEVGQALLNAAQLALFDLGGERFTLVVRDTQGTPEGAVAAAEAALAEQVSLLLGPLFSPSAEAVKPVVEAAEVPMITFSNDTRFAALAPENAYGQLVVDSLREAVFRNGVELSRVVFYDPQSNDVSAEVQVLADFNQRRSAAEAQRRDLQGRSDEAAQRALQRLQGVETVGDLPFDTILLPASGQQLLSIAPLLAYHDVDPSEVRYLGTSLWEDPQLLSEPTLQGGWFPAPPPDLWSAFRTRYEQSFGSTPPRVASLGYDAVALAAVLERRGTAEGAFVPYTPDAIAQSLGFAGIDGIFRFLPTGQVQRGLSILEVQRQGFVQRDPAPTSFPRAIN